MDQNSIIQYIHNLNIQKELNQLLFAEFIVMSNTQEVKIVIQSKNDILKAIVIQYQESIVRPWGMFLLLVGLKLNKVSGQTILQITRQLLQQQSLLGFLNIILEFMQKSALDCANVNEILYLYQQIFNICLEDNQGGKFATYIFQNFKELYSYYRGIFNNKIEEYEFTKYINQTMSASLYIQYAQILGLTRQYLDVNALPEEQQAKYGMILIKERQIQSLPTEDQSIILKVLKKKQLSSFQLLEHALYLIGIDTDLQDTNHEFPTQVENINFCITQCLTLKQLSKYSYQLFNILIQAEKLTKLQYSSINNQQLDSIIKLVKRFLQLWIHWEQFTIQAYNHPFGQIINYLIDCIQGEQKVFIAESAYISCQINYIGFNLTLHSINDPSYLWYVKLYKFSDEQDHLVVKHLNWEYLQQLLSYVLQSESQSLQHAFKFQFLKLNNLPEILDIITGISYLQGNLSKEFIQVSYSGIKDKHAQSIKSLLCAIQIMIFLLSGNTYTKQQQLVQDIDLNLWQLIVMDKQLTQSQIESELFQQQKTQQYQLYILQLIIIYLHIQSQNEKFSFSGLAFNSIYRYFNFSSSNILDLDRELIDIINKTNAQIKYMISQSNNTIKQRQNIKYFLTCNFNSWEESGEQIYVTTQNIYERIVFSCTYLFIVKQIQEDDKTQNYQMQILNQIIAYLALQQNINEVTKNIQQTLKYISYFDNIQLIQDYLQYILYKFQVTEDIYQSNQDENATEMHDIGKFSASYINYEFSKMLQRPNNVEQVMEYLFNSSQITSTEQVQLVILMLVDYINIQYQMDAMELLRFIYNTENIFIKNDFNKRFMDVKTLIVQSIQKYQYNDYQMTQIQKFLQLDNKIITRFDFSQQQKQITKSNLFLDMVIAYLEDNKYQSMYCIGSLKIISKYLNNLTNKNVLINIISKNNIDKIKHYGNLPVKQLYAEKNKVVSNIAQFQFYILNDIMSLRGMKEKQPDIANIIQQLQEHLYRDFNLSEIFISNVINQTRDQQITTYFTKLIRHILSIKYPQYVEVDEDFKTSFELQVYNDEYMIMLFNFIDKSNFLQIEKILDIKSTMRYDNRSVEEQLKENYYYTWFLFAYSARQYQIANQIIEQIYQLYVKLMEDSDKFNDQLLQLLEQNIYDSQVKAYNIDQQDSRISDLLNMMSGIKLNIFDITNENIQNMKWITQNVTQKLSQQIETSFNSTEINYLMLQALLVQYPTYFVKYINSDDAKHNSQNYFNVLDYFIQNNKTNRQFVLNQLQNILEKIIMDADVHQIKNPVFIIDLMEQFFIFTVKQFKNVQNIEFQSIEFIIYAWRLCIQLYNQLHSLQATQRGSQLQRLKSLESFCVLNQEETGQQSEFITAAKVTITQLNEFQLLHLIGPIYNQHSSIQQVLHNDKYINQRLLIVDIILRVLKLKTHLDYYLRQQAFYYVQDGQAQNSQKRTVKLALNKFNNNNAFLNQLIEKQLRDFFTFQGEDERYSQSEKKKMQLYFEEFKAYSAQFTAVSEYLIEKKRDATINDELFCLPSNDFINITKQDNLTMERYEQQVRLHHTKRITFGKVFTSVDMPILYQTDKQLQFIVKKNAHSDQQVSQYYQFLNTLQLDYVTQYKLRPYAVCFLCYAQNVTQPFYFIEFIKNVKDLKTGQQRTEFRNIPIQEPSPRFAQYLYQYKMQQMVKSQSRHFSYSPTKLREQYAERVKIIDSIAFCVVICFVLRIGDRHTSNIVQDINTKELHYIDFDCVFGKGYQLPVTEMVTARLTPQVMHMLQVKQIETRVRQVSQQLLNKIVAHLSTFISTFTRHVGTQKYNSYQTQVYLKILEILQSSNYMRVFEQFLDFQRDPYKLAYMYEGWNGLDDSHYKDLFPQNLKK